MTLSEMYRALLHEQEEAWDDIDDWDDEGDDPESRWLAGYACGIDACIHIVREHLLAEDTEDP